MTVIAIRDGIMAVDSAVSFKEMVIGSVKKWRAVPELFGGGFIAFSGNIDTGGAAMRQFADMGEVIQSFGDFALLHLRQNGSVAEWICQGPWLEFEAPFYAAGSGDKFTTGALAAGATAEQAAKLTCEYIYGCGGEIHILSVNP